MKYQLTDKVTLFWVLVLCLVLSACEDVIDVEVDDVDAVIVIDAWLDDQNTEHVVRVTRSQTYFDNSPPQGVEDAVVTVSRSDGKTFDFVAQGDGYYKVSVAIDSLGEVGDLYQLSVVVDESIYTAQAMMHRVPPIDSIGIEFRDDELFSDDGYYANFFARDFPGTGDAYWIKTYANGRYLDKASELNIAYDAGFDAGTGIDGITFITPIRELVNRLDEDNLAMPYEVGDTIRVEIHSMSNEAFNFMEIVRDQINNSQNGIFSLPLANARTNITSSGGASAVGFFNVARVSSSERTVE